MVSALVSIPQRRLPTEGPRSVGLNDRWAARDPDALTIPLGNPGSQCSEAVREYLAGSLATNTLRAYRSDIAHFVGWGGAIPASAEMVAEYLAGQAGKLSIATLDRRLASLSKVHRVLGLPSPTGAELVRGTFQGIRRRQRRPQRQAKPVTVELLQLILENMGDDLRSIRDRSILLIGFAGALRRSELCSLEYMDVDRIPGGLLLRIRRSKTDQEGQGRVVEITRAPARAVIPATEAARPIRQRAATGSFRGLADLRKAYVDQTRWGDAEKNNGLGKHVVARALEYIVPDRARNSPG